MKKQKTISYSLWERKYKPILNKEGSYKTLHEKNEYEKATKEGRLWTECFSEGCFYVLPGYHFVNRCDYYITEKPCNLVHSSNVNLEVVNIIYETKFYVDKIKALSFIAYLERLLPNCFSKKEAEKDSCFYLDFSYTEALREELEIFCKKNHQQLKDTFEIYW